MKYLKFYGKTCNPCKIADIVLAEKGIEVEAVDVEENEALAGQYGIMKVPTVVKVDEEGNEIERFMGLEQIHEIKG